MGKKSLYEQIKTVVFVTGMISWVIFLILPLPTVIIDIMLAFSLGFALIVLIQASMIDSWDKFKTFPLILLMSTIFRIALNLATTRKIISGESPGQVIESAGHLIVRDQIAIGIVIFIILIIVQFIVANGANRFGEVSARFMLDALPGKQISIDNELNNGAISAEEAKEQKLKLQQQVDYYGSLDGAGKYIKGDVWAGLSMIIVNLVVGFIVGMVSLGLSFSESLARFTILSVGDGVVNIIAAFTITVAGAIVLAKVEENGKDKEKNDRSVLEKIFFELAPNSIGLYIAGTALMLLGLAGLPILIMFPVGGALITVGYMMQRERKKKVETIKNTERINVQKEQNQPKKVQVKNIVEPITVEVGYKLAPLFMNTGIDVFGNKKENMNDKVTIMRLTFANQLGVTIPNIKIRDRSNINPPTKYEIKVKETTVATGIFEQDKVLAIPNLLTLSEIEGEKTREPVYGQEALWIKEDQIEEASEAGYNIWNPLTTVAMHLHEVLEKNIWRFMSLQEVHNLIDGLEEHNKVLKEKMEKIEDTYLLQKVLISLLKERISIKNFPEIVESFLEIYGRTKDIDIIVALIRQRIAGQIFENYKNEDGKVYMISLGEKEQEIKVVNSDGIFHIEMNMAWQQDFVERLKKEKEVNRLASVDPIILVRRPEVRAALSRMLEAFEIETPVVSVLEIPLNVDNEIVNVL